MLVAADRHFGAEAIRWRFGSPCGFQIGGADPPREPPERTADGFQPRRGYRLDVVRIVEAPPQFEKRRGGTDLLARPVAKQDHGRHIGPDRTVALDAQA